MKIKSASLQPLRSKYYETEIFVNVDDENGDYYTVRIDLTGHYPKPSQREIDGGWEPDEGMDHVEPEACHLIAEMIVACLQKEIDDE
jgi:hypothetical protein